MRLHIHRFKYVRGWWDDIPVWIGPQPGKRGMAHASYAFGLYRCRCGEERTKIMY